jgi:iron complex transport system permease protein
VGSGLALGGIILQAILKNPLAESYTLGISGGASIGIATGIILGRASAIPAFAFFGSMISVLLLLLFCSFRKLSAGTILLFGIMLNFIFSSFSLLAISLLQQQKFMEAVIWFMGDLGSTSAQILKAAPFFLVPLFAAAWLFWKDLNLFSLGDEKASSLGLNLQRKKFLWLTLAALITGFCVSLAGLIGFVGLVIPHITRIFLGADHRKAIPAAALIGGSFLILADTLARTLVKPIEIPVGIISGFFGGLFFVFVLMKTTRKQAW